MSSKPDGTDPRILQPEGETVYIASAARQSKGRKYHKEDCDDLDALATEPKEKDIAVVKWKGMHPCSHCFGGPSSERTPDLEGPDVDRIRIALVRTQQSMSKIAPGYGFVRSTIRYHACAKRTYNYQTPPETPPVEYVDGEYQWVEK